MTTKRSLCSSILNPVLASVLLASGAGCLASSASEDASDVGEQGAALTASPHEFAIGMSNEVGGYEAFRRLAKIPGSEARICHVYTYWDIAQHDVNPNHSTGGRAGLFAFMRSAEATCDDVLVTFQGPGGTAVTRPPSAQQFEDAFVAFQAWTEAGGPLAAWAGKLTYTAWNEPNNPSPDGNALNHDLTPEQAASYYLRARKHCRPSEGCEVAAGDFATNGSWAEDIGQNCGDDLSASDTETRCATPSEYNKTDAAPTYLDRYKTYIARNAASDGLGAGFTPEHFSYHPWHDVNSYIDTSAECSTYENCSTRRLLVALSGPWQHADLWDTEIGLGLQNSTPPSEKTTQPCAAAFLVQLTDLSPRFTRLYFMKFSSTNGPLLDNFPARPTLRPAGRVLADRETSYSGAKCAPTGITVEK